MLFSQNALICWPHIWNTLYPFWSMLNVSINQESVTINLKLFPIPLDSFCFFWRLTLFKIFTSTQDDCWSSLWYLLGLNKYAKNKTFFLRKYFMEISHYGSDYNHILNVQGSTFFPLFLNTWHHINSVLKLTIKYQKLGKNRNVALIKH